MKGSAPTIRNRYLFVADLLAILVSVFVSFALRLDVGDLFVSYLPLAVWLAVQAVVVKPVVFWAMGLYRRYWAYASVQELVLIFNAVGLSSLILAVWVFVNIVLRWNLVPRSIPFIDWLVTLFLVGGIRLSVRVISEVRRARRILPGAHGARRILIAGAGDAGALVAREMQKNPQLRMQPVGFLDDAPEKLHQRIHGIPVRGTLSHLGLVASEQNADEVVIAMPSASGEVFRRVADTCRAAHIPFRTMPGLFELIGGRVSVSRLRDVEVGDLLRRQPARTADQAVGRALSGRRVLVTGAGGSIGLELCRQIARWGPAELILLGHGENSIFEALIELGEVFPSLPAASGRRRYPRSDAPQPGVSQPSSERRLPRGRAQARAAHGGQPRRRRHQQRLRHAQRGGSRAGCGGRAVGAHLERQGHPPDRASWAPPSAWRNSWCARPLSAAAANSFRCASAMCSARAVRSSRSSNGRSLAAGR